LCGVTNGKRFLGNWIFSFFSWWTKNKVYKLLADSRVITDFHYICELLTFQTSINEGGLVYISSIGKTTYYLWFIFFSSWELCHQLTPAKYYQSMIVEEHQQSLRDVEYRWKKCLILVFPTTGKNNVFAITDIVSIEVKYVWRVTTHTSIVVIAIHNCS